MDWIALKFEDLEVAGRCVLAVDAAGVLRHVSAGIREAMATDPTGCSLAALSATPVDESGALTLRRDDGSALALDGFWVSGKDDERLFVGLPVDAPNEPGGIDTRRREIEPRQRETAEPHAVHAEAEHARIGALYQKEQIPRARCRAEDANLAKSEFLANMSHEIRTPMTAILGFADLLLSEGPREDQTEALRTIRQNGEHLIELINDILDLSKVETGRMQIDPCPTDLHALLESVYMLMRNRARAKGVGLVVEYDGRIPRTITTDAARVRQVLANLVGNAVKFTRAGCVRLEARVVNVSGHASVELAVHDTGIGMSKEQIDRIFRPFEQADGSSTRSFGGSGLGLAISQRLAGRLGGALTVDSTPGTGSTFRFCFDGGSIVNAEFHAPPRLRQDVDVSDTSEVTPDVAAVNAPPLGDAAILVAEDGVDNQRLVRHYLARAGADVRIVENGRLALEAVCGVDGWHPDLIVMDMQMPEMDGYEATRRLRAAGFDRPIVALTAHAMQGDRERCLAAGCDDYLTKPIKRDVFVECCRDWLSRRRRHAG